MDAVGIAILILMGVAFLLGVAGAIALFIFAIASGFVGLIAYVAAWVYLTTFMAVISVISGFITVFWLMTRR